MNPQIRADIIERLVRDLEFKDTGGKYLRKGKCPSCGHKTMFIESESPWMLKCGRENHCGIQIHVKDQFPELFNSWSERFGRPSASGDAPSNPNAVADAYLQYGRGFDLKLIKGWYTQESYFDPRLQIGSATVRFPLLDGWWERLIDKPERFGKKKARIKYDLLYGGQWWAPPSLALTELEELWIVEGIFDAIALLHQDIGAVSTISCYNYPADALADLAKACDAAGTERPKLVWALDGDAAGRRYTLKHIKRAREEGWKCEAAQIPQRGRKRDWNDCHQRGELASEHIEEYRYHGALLTAESAAAKALLIYKHTERREFSLEYRNRLYYFSLNLEKYEKARREIVGDEDAPLTPKQRDEALKQAGSVTEIANCNPTFLYYQANEITDESWYYARVDFPHDGGSVKNTFSGSQLASASEFKKRLLSIAPGAIWTGSSQQLDKLLRDQLSAIKTVDTIDYIGYAKEHGAYVFGDIAVKGGKVYTLNAEDHFELGRTSIKTLSRSVQLQINPKREQYRSDWAQTVWRAFGARGVVAIAFWLGSLFAEQIRAEQKSYPFLEIIGEADAGKTTLIEFLWKLVGRTDYEGFDPAKATAAARARNFAQVSNLPVVLIESDREQEAGAKQRQFDWDELKTAYNGRNIRSRGHKNNGNDTYEPPFRGAIVISQNNAVSASEAILTRIVHLHFTREHQTPETLQLARQLERMPAEDVSGFVLAATEKEEQLLKTINEKARHYENALAELSEIRVHRIRKCHAQMMALVECLGDRGLGLLPAHALAEAQELLEDMAIERQQAVNADHPAVAEFWEAFDYIEGLKDRAVLNHYGPDADQIAVNLKHFEHEAAEHKLRVPPATELKRYLRTSKARKYIESNRSVRSQLLDRTVKCWIFAKEK